MNKTLWDWDKVFEHLVRMCNTHGGYYKLPPQEVAQLKSGPIGKGWGRANLRQNVLPKYRKIYPYYEFGVSSDRKYLWCKKL
jgi:hypothetical protein